MTIDEARTWLQRHADSTPMPRAREAYQTILEALRRTRWIPVTERLPEKRRMVLLHFESGYELVGCLTNSYREQNCWVAKKSIPQAWRLLSILITGCSCRNRRGWNNGGWPYKIPDHLHGR